MTFLSFWGDVFRLIGALTLIIAAIAAFNALVVIGVVICFVLAVIKIIKEVRCD